MLRKLEIVSPELLFAWGGLIDMMLASFRREFGRLPGYVPPQIRIVQAATAWEMNIHNWRAIMSVKPTIDQDL